MYGVFTYIYHKFQPNVGKYIIHGWYGIYFLINKQMVASFMVPSPAKEVLPTVVVYASALGPCGWNWALQLLGQGGHGGGGLDG